ncbi:MAG: cell division protein FtsA [Candidatus Omnitrophica bacterium]|nr:cell division protein FtsA [Candidatus Omnitrophota bacterium]
MRREIICGLDIGTSKISVILGEFSLPHKLNILAKAKVEPEGLERGKVLDIEKFTHSIESVMHMTGADRELKPVRIILGVGNDSLRISQYRRSSVLSERSQEIKNFHIERLREETLEMAVPFDHEVLHIFSKEFMVDGQAQIRDPRGMFGNRISADFLLVTISSSVLHNIKRGIYNAGYAVDTVVFSDLASAFTLLDEGERNEGVIFLKIGGGMTTVVKFSGGVPVFLEIIPFGGIDIDTTIAKALGISQEEAKELREKYGGFPPGLPQEKIIIEKSGKVVKCNELAGIINRALERVLFQIRKRIEKYQKLDYLPYGIVLGGGVFLFEGLVEKVEEVFRLPARLGVVKDVEDSTGKESNFYAWADPLGLVKFSPPTQVSNPAIDKHLNPFQRLFLRTKKIFEEYF